jgi:thioredoxin 1
MTFQELINREKPTLVDFYADWCGPCKLMGPVLQEVKKRLGESASIIKVNVDQSPETAVHYNVQGVPTLLLFKNGRMLWRKSGVVQAAELEKIINSHIHT